MSKINPKDINFMLEKIKDQVVRSEITKNSHFLFFYIYLSRFATVPMAPFHQRLFAITEDENIRIAAITAFRGSSKSTIMSTSYALWSVLGIQQKKYVVIFSRNQEQSRQHFKNIKEELENNPLLKADLGPFKRDEWNSTSIVIPKYGARITTASSEQSVRGLISGPNRPDLVICDDVEDSESVKGDKGRKRIYDWFNNEIVPLGDNKTKIIVIGNFLHRASLLMKLKQEINDGKRDGVYEEYPLVNKEGQCLWPGKYPNQKAIEQKRKDFGGSVSFQREFLLLDVDDKEAVVQKSWINYYKELPKPKDKDYSYYAIGIDPAISEDGNFTAIVSAKIIPQENGRSLIYILPNPICEHLSLTDIAVRVKNLVASFGGRFSTRVYTEEVALQGYLTQALENNFEVEGFKVRGMNKRARLVSSSPRMQEGEIFFPEIGADPLVNQILDFGKDLEDDLVDAFTVLVLKIIEKDSESMPNIYVIDGRIF